MKQFGAWLLCGGLLAAAPAAAGPVLHAAVPAAKLPAAGTLGVVQVHGIGSVKVSFSRAGARVRLTATDASGAVLGFAETTVGLAETPIAVRGAAGLARITVLWPQSSTRREAGPTPD